MLVFWEQRLVFLATPKTGSTAIEIALESLAELAIQRPPQLKHTNAFRYRTHIEPFLAAASGAKFTVVALMREPVSWLGSWYRFRQRDELLGKARSTAGLSFDEFVQSYCSDRPATYADVGAQSRFLMPDTVPGVDRIFRYEDIGCFVDFLEDRLDCEIILPRVNVSPDGVTELSPGLAEELRKKSAPDFDLYARLEIGSSAAR